MIADDYIRAAELLRERDRLVRSNALEEAARIAESVTEIPMHSHWETVIAEKIRELKA